MTNENSASETGQIGQVKIEFFRTIMSFIVGGIALFAILVGVWTSYNAIHTGNTKDSFHPLQIMGLFYASGGPVVLLTLFRTTDGPIEIDLGFLKFKGASGPIIMWILLFITICTGMKMLNLDH